MFSMCSELTPRARIPDTRIPQFMQPWSWPFLCNCMYFDVVVYTQAAHRQVDIAHNVCVMSGPLEPLARPGLVNTFFVANSKTDPA